ncbi:MAG: sulfatase-like hydrolase/transferase [Candidatus Krumholzibacteria bacterium]|nr:sulfatase-like hydrolase/transferase [Candidatus Krumholzibacteria bacterium]
MNRTLQAIRIILDRFRWLTAFMALNAPLAFLLIDRNMGGISLDFSSTTYLLGVVLGWYMLPIMLIGLGFCLFLSPRYRASGAVCIVLVSFFLFYLLVDGFVYPITHFHIDMFWLDFLIHDFHGLGMPTTMLLAAVAALTVLLLVESVLFHFASRVRHHALVSVGFPLLVVAGLVGSQVIHIIAYEKNIDAITRLTPALPFYIPLHSSRHGGKLDSLFGQVVDDFSARETSLEQGNFLYPLSKPAPDTLATDPPNIVVIFLESWRADTMNGEVSPNIAALATESTVCQEHFSTGNSTVAGVFGFFYGIQPTYWKAVKANSTAIDNPVLMDVLRDRGYRFGVFAKSRFHRHKIDETIFRGITIHEDFQGRDDAQQDVDLTNRMLAWLDDDAGDRPFFLFAFYKASHFDYNYDEAHDIFHPSGKLGMSMVGGRKDPRLYYNDYRNAIHFDDEQVGRVIDHLEERELLDNTIVILSSDHAEEFDDNGADYWGHGSNFTRYQTQVPMIMHLPDRPPRQITARTSHLDMAPTLLQEYLGIRGPAAIYSDGVNFLATDPPDRTLVIASYFNHAFLVGDNVYAVVPTSLKKYRLDDIQKKADPVDPVVFRGLIDGLGRFFR